MSKTFQSFIGIDISKLWFDAALLHPAESSQIKPARFKQSPEGFQNMITWLAQNKVALDDKLLFCMEYTGVYNTALVSFLVQQKAHIWVEMALRIKKAAGFERGSDDKTSAAKIAFYAWRFQDRVKLWQPADSNIEQLKNLLSQRDRLITSIKLLKVPIEELKHAGSNNQAKVMEKLQQPVLRALEKAKKDIEAFIIKTVQQDEKLHNQVTRVQSVRGIGVVTSVALLVYTGGFTAFDNAKQLACYCGVVPFSKSSGTSVRFKSTVSPFANMKLKKLLHLCAMSAIQNDPELKTYFERKVKEGKNKMCVINAVRNKLLHRVFAVLRDERMYEDNYPKICA